MQNFKEIGPVQLGSMERLDFKPSWFLRVFLRIFLVVKGMPSIANLIFIDYPSPKLHYFFCFGFLDQVLHIFHLDFVMTLFFFTNFQCVNFDSNFFFFIFLFFKNFWSTYLSGHSARSARRLESKPAATGLDSSLGYLRETLFSGLKRLDFKPFKPTNWAGTELKAVIHTSLSIII